jgi:hypothetical protein
VERLRGEVFKATQKRCVKCSGYSGEDATCANCRNLHSKELCNEAVTAEREAIVEECHRRASLEIGTPGGILWDFEEWIRSRNAQEKT